MEELVNVFKFVKESDCQFDKAHGSDHCIDVLKIALNSLYTIGKIEGLSEEKVGFILMAAVLLHEQKDRKRGNELNEKDMIDSLKKDGFSDEEIKIIDWLISYCSFSKSNEPGRKDLEMVKYEKIMNLLSSADLAEAVNEKALWRSYEYHKKRLEKNNTFSERECWKNVYDFYCDKKSGFFSRLNAISVKEIRDDLDSTLKDTDNKMMEKVKEFNL